MLDKTSLGAAAALLCLTTAANAQLTVQNGSAPNASTTLDFDSPAAPAGPATGTDPFLTAAGISSIVSFGTWTATGDMLSAPSNVFGQGLVVQNGGLFVGSAGDPLDEPGAGAGIEISLANPANEFGVLFTDQLGFYFTIELFSGANAVGGAAANYSDLIVAGFPRDPVYVHSTSPFDRVIIKFPLGSPGVGFDDIQFGSGPNMTGVPANCIDTGAFGINGGNSGGAVYFDVTANNGSLSFDVIESRVQAASGAPVGIEVYTKSGTSVGFEQDPGAWVLAATDDGLALAADIGVSTSFTLTNPVTLPQGVTGVALVAVNTGHTYTNGFVFNQSQTSADGSLSIQAGTASNAPFVGPLFDPRVWNGRICVNGGTGNIGSSYCTAAANSTGNMASISAAGSIIAGDNDLTLTAAGLPPMQFGIFITSQTQASAPLASGILCVGGTIIRFQGPGQILQANVNGEYSLQIDTQALPAGVPTPINPGETYNFTTWFRDIDPMIGNTANFSDGVSITFN